MAERLASNAEWQVWGKQDPLWGVASWPGKERGGANPWTDAEFYALGSDWFEFSRAWFANNPGEPGTVLEIGCGAGRITQMLARSFPNVIATDVSADVMEYAKGRIPASNVEWVLSNGKGIPAADGSVDQVFSCHVLQHLPSREAQLGIFKEVLRILRGNGTFFIHIPMYLFPDVNASFAKFAERSYSAFLGLAAMKAFLQKVRMRLTGKPFMRGTSFEMEALVAAAKEIGFVDVAPTIVISKANGRLHTCLFGRKPTLSLGQQSA